MKRSKIEKAMKEVWKDKNITLNIIRQQNGWEINDFDCNTLKFEDLKSFSDKIGTDRINTGIDFNFGDPFVFVYITDENAEDDL